MIILVINAGSSSIKYELFNMDDKNVLCRGALERIGEEQSRLHHHWTNSGEELAKSVTGVTPNHHEGMVWIEKTITETLPESIMDNLAGIGHRVVHGGYRFRDPVLLTPQTVQAIAELTDLAPLHNPANLTGINAAREHFKHLPQVAVFDTAFHHTMPPHAYHYALPLTTARSHHIRRYGFHGTSHAYVTRQAAWYLGRSSDGFNAISLHLGNGASAAAVQGGKCMDTSMGLTPLEGLMMGTRCGDLDPGVVFHLQRQGGMEVDAIDRLLNKESGLKGIAGANDMRKVLERAEQGDEEARLAIDMYCYRIKKYIGAYFAVLGRVDALVFTAGIGENAPAIRENACENLQALGIGIDPHKNRHPPDAPVWSIADDNATVEVLVCRTDEEWEIADQTRQVINALA